MKKVVITTVGISLIENLNIKIDKSLKTSFTKGKIADKSDVKVELINDLEAKLAEKNSFDNTICAELQSLGKIRGTYSELQVYLICTDTILSHLCAEYIAKKLGEEYIKTEVITDLVIDGTDAAVIFEEKGFHNLVEQIQKIDTESVGTNRPSASELNLASSLIESESVEKNRPIINISGGYKALIPVMTIIGQLYDMEINYLYEDSNELIIIKRLPLYFDWTLGEIYIDYLTKDGLRVINSTPDILKQVRDLGLVKKKEYKLTLIGQLFRTYILGLNNTKKGTIGYLAELKIYQYYVENYCQTYNTIKQGWAIWWDNRDASRYFDEQCFTGNHEDYRKIDIDIFLSNGIDQIWSEVKAYSENGVKKAYDQVQVFMDFIKCTGYQNVSTVQLIFYKLVIEPEEKHERKLKEIRELVESNSLMFEICFINLQPTQKGLPNIKAFFEHKIKLVPYNLSK